MSVVSPLRGGDRRWGEDSFLSPNRCSAFRATRGISRTPSNLGARSPSGNARGGWPRVAPTDATLARNKYETTKHFELELEFRQFLLKGRNPPETATDIPNQKGSRAKKPRMNTVARRGRTRNSGSGGTLS